ncbi:hypothetical protein TNCV_834751 [Trichonephila clavipes]|nr:hypothetical protein TNCV_834751 [Trichonephila clavipes]
MKVFWSRAKRIVVVHPPLQTTTFLPTSFLKGILTEAEAIVATAKETSIYKNPLLHSYEPIGYSSTVVMVTNSWPVLNRGFKFCVCDATEDSPRRGTDTCYICHGSKSSRWCGVEVRREKCRLMSRPQHLTTVQNCEVHLLIAFVLL